MIEPSYTFYSTVTIPDNYLLISNEGFHIQIYAMIFSVVDVVIVCNSECKKNIFSVIEKVSK